MSYKHKTGTIIGMRSAEELKHACYWNCEKCEDGVIKMDADPDNWTECDCTSEEEVYRREESSREYWEHYHDYRGDK